MIHHPPALLRPLAALGLFAATLGFLGGCGDGGKTLSGSGAGDDPPAESGAGAATGAGAGTGTGTGTTTTPVEEAPAETGTAGGDPGPRTTLPATAAAPAASPTGDPLADRVHAILVDLQSGKAGDGDRAALEDRLGEKLEEMGLGDPQSRTEVSALTIRVILERVKAAGGARGAGTSNIPPEMVAQGLKTLAREFSSDLYRRLPKAGQGRAHEGSLLATTEAKPPEGYIAAPWRVLGGFEYVEHKPLPETVTAFHGKKVAATGFMMTLEEVEDIHEFLLVESIWSCCFGQPPEVHQVFVIKVPAKKGVEYTSAPIQVAGTLDVGEEVEDGFVISVYRLTADKITEIP